MDGTVSAEERAWPRGFRTRAKFVGRIIDPGRARDGHRRVHSLGCAAAHRSVVFLPGFPARCLPAFSFPVAPPMRAGTGLRRLMNKR